jgi:hypothetical protein
MTSEDNLETLSGLPENVNKIQVRVEVKGPLVIDAFLLLDGKRHQTVTLTDSGPTYAYFGIHENTPWYHVTFPGEGWEVVEDVPDKVFEILQRLTDLVKETIERKSDVILDITDDLKDTGCELSTSLLGEKDIEIRARRFTKSR